MTKWNKYTHVCEICDALIIYTSARVVRQLTCECGGKCNWISEDPAIIQPTNEKEKEMEYDGYATILTRTTDYTTGLTTDVTVSALDVETMRRKINNLETRLNAHEKIVSQIKENLAFEGWYAESTDKEDVLADLCSIVVYEPIATLRFSTTITVEGSVDVPLSEVDNYDLRYDLNDNLSLESSNNNMEIDSYYVDDTTSEEWS
jgi:hypothetical protein